MSHLNLVQLDSTTLQQALTLLKNGGLIAFPTDTVYGLAADAGNPLAIDKIYQIKQRPRQQALPVLLANANQVLYWTNHIPDSAWLLMEKFWPGPLTLVLPKAAHVLDNLVAGQTNIALRVPNHPIALQLLAHTQGLAVTSANRSTHLSATTAQHVQEELGNAVEMIIDGGITELGLESTIIDLTQSHPILVRNGALSVSPIEEILQISLPIPTSSTIPFKINKIIELVAHENLLERIESFLTEARKFTVIAYHQAIKKHANLNWIILPDQPEDYARYFYPTLRKAMQLNCDKIFIEKVPELPEWQAIKERLLRL